MNDEELRAIFEQMEADGWHPMLCDTKIDVYDNPVNCGVPLDVGDCSTEAGWYSSELMPPNRLFKVPARGDSMVDAGIEPGDMLTVESDAQIHDDDLVLARIEGEFTVKAYYEDDAGDKWLMPYNEKYSPIRLNAGQKAYVCGKVIEVSKRYPRVRHRDSSRILRHYKEQAAEPRKLSLDEVMERIRLIAPQIKQARHWFAVYRPLVQFRHVANGDYAGFCQLVASSVPDHEKQPNAQELQRMDVLSFTKSVVLWDESNAPVTGQRFKYYKSIGEQMVTLMTS